MPNQPKRKRSSGEVLAILAVVGVGLYLAWRYLHKSATTTPSSTTSTAATSPAVYYVTGGTQAAGGGTTSAGTTGGTSGVTTTGSVAHPASPSLPTPGTTLTLHTAQPQPRPSTLPALSPTGQLRQPATGPPQQVLGKTTQTQNRAKLRRMLQGGPFITTTTPTGTKAAEVAARAQGKGYKTVGGIIGYKPTGAPEGRYVGLATTKAA